MTDSRKILIVSYQIPPYGGIGGRRWAKFGIELIKKGYDIHFLAAEPDKDRSQKWKDNFNFIKDRIEYFGSKYPIVLKSGANTFTEKLAYRFQLGKLKNSEKGNYFDHSCCDEDIIRKRVQEKINQGFKTVISTGAPFTQLYFIARLKKERNDFTFIADLRDPWTFQDWSYGFQTIEAKRKRIEQERERFVIEYADHIFTVANKMSTDFQDLSNRPNNIHTLSNGFDPLEYLNQNKKTKNSDKIKFIFAGNYYDSALHHIQELVNNLIDLRQNNFELYNNLEFNFYGSVPDGFLDIVKEESKIHFHGSIPSNEVSTKLIEADIAMLFLIDGFNYSLSTKFFEYIALSKPILLFAKEGETSEFISSQKIGWHFQADEFHSRIREIIELKSKSNLGLNSDFDKNQFSIPILTEKIIEVLEN